MHDQGPLLAYDSLVAAAKISPSPTASTLSGEASTPSTIAEEPEIIDIDDAEVDMEFIATAMEITSVYSNASSEEYVVAPLQTPHFRWNCTIVDPQFPKLLSVNALIDHGSSLVMIDAETADKLELKRHRLDKPIFVRRMAVGKGNKVLQDYVHITPFSPCCQWQSNPLKLLFKLYHHCVLHSSLEDHFLSRMK